MLQRIKEIFVVDSLKKAIFFWKIAWISLFLGGFVFWYGEGMGRIPLVVILLAIWIFLDRKYQCPVCHKSLQATRVFQIPTYCPHCGERLER